MSKKTLVMKFGGTSVGTAEAMRQVVEIVAASLEEWPRLVVVSSALSGVTDLLLESARRAAEPPVSRTPSLAPDAPGGQLSSRLSWLARPAEGDWRHAAQVLRQRHTDLAYALLSRAGKDAPAGRLYQDEEEDIRVGRDAPLGRLPSDDAQGRGEGDAPAGRLYGGAAEGDAPPGRLYGGAAEGDAPAPPPLLGPLLVELNALVDEFEHLCQAVSILGEATPRALDAIGSLGERLSVPILAAALQARAIPAQAVEATRLIVTDARFTNAAPDLAATTLQVQAELEPLLARRTVPVVTGFIGATRQGFVTTLGRGGSDTSASILALVLGASELWIWTDVDGVMTADPRLVPHARTIPVLSYREVAEMAYFGAKVLHPRSIYPALEAGIPLRVRNTFNPLRPETCLVPEHQSNGRGHLKAVTAIRGLQMITLSGRGMLGVPGVAGRIFTAAATTGVSIPIIIESTSEQSIAFAAPQAAIPAVLAALSRDLQAEFERGDIDAAEASEEVSILTLICPGIRSTVGIAGRIFGAIGSAGINVQAISYGSSDYSISLVVSAGDLVSALTALHELVE